MTPHEEINGHYFSASWDLINIETWEKQLADGVLTVTYPCACIKVNPSCWDFGKSCRGGHVQRLGVNWNSERSRGQTGSSNPHILTGWQREMGKRHRERPLAGKARSNITHGQVEPRERHHGEPRRRRRTHHGRHGHSPLLSVAPYGLTNID